MAKKAAVNNEFTSGSFKKLPVADKFKKVFNKFHKKFSKKQKIRQM